MGYQQKKYKKFVATAATATLVASAIVPVASAKSFSDVAENNEFQPFINALSDSKIINGYADGTFKPGAKLTRGQVVKMLGRWVESNGTAIPTDWNSKQRFNDVPVNSADQELVKYAALVKDAGVFNGSNGNLMAGNNITRQQMAKVLNGAYEAVKGVSLVELAKGVDDVLIQDLGKSYQEFEGHIQALVDLKISTVSVFRPTENVTRAQFAKFLYNTINLNAETVGEVTYKVAAVNATTVEVTFPSDIKNIKDLDFKIEGLEVKNAVVKQTAANVAVLTTAAQQADKEYTVTVDGEKVGSFKGIGAVIPTEIKVEQASYQAKVGQQVTLKAKTTPGAAVTFNVQATGNSLNENKKHEVYAGTDGVATYTYTQYGVAGVDNVTVYPTGAPNLLDYAKVYWGKSDILTVDVEEKVVDNGGVRTYKVVYKDPTTGNPVSGKKLNVTFKENLNDVAGSVKTDDTDASIRKDNGQYVTPYQDSNSAAGTNREEEFEIVTNSVGEATFTVTGKNTTATPIVFVDEDNNNRFGATELQATAGKVKFQGAQSDYTFQVTSPTADRVAAIATTTQDNEVTYKFKVNTKAVDKDGKPVPYRGGVVKVAIQQNQDATLTNNTPAQIKSDKSDYTSSGVVTVQLDQNGEGSFKIKSAVDNSKATPVMWIDLNTAGKADTTVGNSKLEDGEPNLVAPTTTFLKSVVVNAASHTLNKPTAGAYINDELINWKAGLVNQSGKESETAGIHAVTYTIKNTTTGTVTFNPSLVDASGVAYKDLTITYDTNTVTSKFTNGNAVTLNAGSSVTIHGVAPSYVKGVSNAITTVNGVQTIQNVDAYSNTTYAILSTTAPTITPSNLFEGSLEATAVATTVKRQNVTDYRNNNNTYNFDTQTASFIKNVQQVPANQTTTGVVVGYDVNDVTAAKATTGVNSLVTRTANKFNTATNNSYGRVIVKEDVTGVYRVYNYDRNKETKFYGVTSLANLLAANATNSPLLGNVTVGSSLYNDTDHFETLVTLKDTVRIDTKSAGTADEVFIVNTDGTPITHSQKSGNGAVATVTQVVSAATVDSDKNGTIDRINVTFNAPVTQDQVNKLKRLVGTEVLTGVTVSGNPVSLKASNYVVNGNTVTFDVSGTTPVNTAYLAGQTLLFDADAAKVLGIKNNSVKITDGAAPVVLDAVVQNNDGKNGVDTVVFTFSEPINNVIDLADFRFALDAAGIHDASKYVIGKSSSFNADRTKLTVHFDNFNNENSVVADYARLNSAVNNLGIVDLAGNDLGAYNNTLTLNPVDLPTALANLKATITTANETLETVSDANKKAALQAAITAAEAVANKSGATVAELTKAVEDLKKAVEAAKKEEGANVTTVKFGTIGASQNVSASLGNTTVVSFLVSELAEANKGTKYVLVFEGKPYEFKQSSVNAQRYTTTIPKQVTDVAELKDVDFQITK